MKNNLYNFFIFTKNHKHRLAQGNVQQNSIPNISLMILILHYNSNNSNYCRPIRTYRSSPNWCVGCVTLPLHQTCFLFLYFPHAFFFGIPFTKYFFFFVLVQDVPYCVVLNYMWSIPVFDGIFQQFSRYGTLNGD